MTTDSKEQKQTTPASSPPPEQQPSMSTSNATSGNQQQGQPQQPKPSSAAVVPSSLKDGIKVAVGTTNDALAQLETSTDKISKPIVSRLSMLQRQAGQAGRRALNTYEKRQEYGREIVLGSSLLVGGVAGFRRGRLVGATAGLLAAGVSYGAVYDFDLYRLPDYVFGEKKDED